MNRWIRRILRLPPGVGALLRPAARVKAILSVLGSVVTAALDMLGVAALIPLTQLLTGAPVNEGPLGFVWQLTGQPTNEQLALIILAAVVGAFVLKSVLTIFIRWWQLGFLGREAMWASVTLMRGYLRPPYSFHLQRSVPDLMRVVGDCVTQSYSGVIGGLLAILAEGLAALALVTLLVVTSPLAAGIALAYLALVSTLMARVLGRRSRSLAALQLDENLRSFQAVLQPLLGVKEIMVRHNSEAFTRRYESSQQSLFKIRREILFLGELPKYLLELTFITGVALLAGTSYLTQGSGTAVTSLAVFIAAGFRLLPGVVRIIAASNLVRAGIPGLEMLLQDFPRYVDLKPEERADRPAPLEGEIELQHVSYRYPGSEVDVVSDVSVTIPRGSTLAIVGLSGSGKSTLITLVLGLLDPTEGRILAGGRPITEDMDAWHAGIGLVPQPIYTFDGTLRDNVTFALDESEVDDARVLQAIERAAVDDIATTRGLDTMLGDRGVGVSGGQQQRIGLARALYYQPSVLILDEATSALDGITELRVTQTLAELGDDTTVIVIAHRLSTVQHADRVLFLDEGRVAGLGTFAEVQQQNETFRRLVELGSLDFARPDSADGPDQGAAAKNT